MQESIIEVLDQKWGPSASPNSVAMLEKSIKALLRERSGYLGIWTSESCDVFAMADRQYIDIPRSRVTVVRLARVQRVFVGSDGRPRLSLRSLDLTQSGTVEIFTAGKRHRKIARTIGPGTTLCMARHGPAKQAETVAKLSDLLTTAGYTLDCSNAVSFGVSIAFETRPAPNPSFMYDHHLVIQVFELQHYRTTGEFRFIWEGIASLNDTLTMNPDRAEDVLDLLLVAAFEQFGRSQKLRKMVLAIDDPRAVRLRRGTPEPLP